MASLAVSHGREVLVLACAGARNSGLGRANTAAVGGAGVCSVVGHLVEPARPRRRRPRRPARGESSQLTALAMSVTVPSWWSSAARSVASSMTSSGTLQVVLGDARAAAPAGAPRRSRCSRPCRRSAGAGRAAGRCAARSTVSRSASSGSPPSGRPTGGVPVQYASPPRRGQRRRAAHADERPARPGAAVLGRLEQEGARPVRRELAVHARPASPRRRAACAPPG